MSTLSVGVVSFGSHPLAVRALESLSNGSLLPGQVVLVENSQDPEHWRQWVDWAQKLTGGTAAVEPVTAAGTTAGLRVTRGGTAWTFLRSARNGGYCAGNNLALSVVESTRHLVLNPDCELLPDGLAHLDAELVPPVAVVSGVLLRGPDAGTATVDAFGGEVSLLTGRSSAAYAGWRVDDLPRAPRARRHLISTYAGACALFDTAALRAVGGFPERYFLYFDEAHVAGLLARRGGSVAVIVQPVALHGRHSTTRAREAQTETPLEAYHSARSALLLARTLGKPYAVLWGAGRLVKAGRAYRTRDVSWATLRGLVDGARAA